MKGIYYYLSNDVNDKTSGIEKKIRMQFDSLIKNNINLDIFSISQNKLVFKFIRRIPFLSTFNNRDKKRLFIKKIEDYNFIYIRKSFFDKQFLSICREIKQRNSNIKLIIEIPTFPYDHEWSKFSDWGILIKDKIYRNHLSKYVDRIVTLSEDEQIFGIKTIKIQNGIDVNGLTLKSPYQYKECINLIGVAVLTFWHGYDRIIKGLAKYYGNSLNNRKVIFNIVGEGVELKRLKKMVNYYKIEEYVLFHGKKHGVELDELINQNDIAVGSLGIHRLKLESVSTLKAKEYCARGIPFIKAYNEKDFSYENHGFFIDFPSDETSIEVEKIVEFYEQTYKNEDKNLISHKMREYAQNNLTWDIKMKPIISYLNYDS